MGKDTEKGKFKVNWALLVLLIIAVGLYSNLLGAFLSGIFSTSFQAGPVIAFCVPYAAGAMGILLIFSLLMRTGALRDRLTPEAMTYIYAALVSTLSAANYSWPYDVFSGTGPLVRTSAPELHGAFVPDTWMPPLSVVQGIIPGGLAPDWAGWGPSMATWILSPVLLFFMISSWTTILRRLWIVEEEMPFPIGSSAFQVVQEVGGSKESPSLFRKTWLLAGIVIGFLFYLPYLLTVAYPWFPDLYGWTHDPPFMVWQAGVLDLVYAYPSLRAIVGLCTIALNPIWIALMYFSPLDLLLSLWGFSVIFLVVEQVLYAFGYYTAAATATSVWGRLSSLNRDPPLKLRAFGYFGVLPGIIVFYIFLRRKSIATTIRLALGRGTDAERLIEKDQPMSYRANYIMAIISTIAVIAFFATRAGMDIAPAIMMVIMIFFTALAWVRMSGAYGVFPEDPAWSAGWMKAIYPTMTLEGRTQSYVMSSTLASAFPWNAVPYSSGFDTCNVYKFAHLSKASSRNCFLIMALATVLTSIVSIVMMIYLAARIGWFTLPFAHEYDWFNYSDPESYAINPVYGDWYLQAIGGFIFAGILQFLRLRFAWWPLDPMGVVFVAGQDPILYGWWWSALFAWIAKFLTFRVGGTKAYSDYGRPIATGFMIGHAIVWVFIAGPLGSIRFFVPT